MIMNDCIRTLLKACPGDRLFVAKQEDYYEGNSKPIEAVDVVKENGKLIILTQ